MYPNHRQGACKMKTITNESQAERSVQTSTRVSQPAKKKQTSLSLSFGGAFMFAGAIALMIAPIVAGSAQIPEGILIFGLASMLGGWVLALVGASKKSDSLGQPGMGD